MNRFHRTGLPLYALANSRSEGLTVSGGTALGACLSASAIYNVIERLHFHGNIFLRHIVEQPQQSSVVISVSWSVNTIIIYGNRAIVGCSNRSGRDKSSFFRLPAVIKHQGQQMFEISMAGYISRNGTERNGMFLRNFLGIKYGTEH